MIVDTHIHLYDERYKNLDELLKEAKECDVGKMIIVGYDYESSLKALKMAQEFDYMFASIGLHPSEVRNNSMVDWVKELAQKPKVVAIGEIGLDYYWDKTYKDKQKELFVKQIDIAKELNLPVIIHSREATLDTFNILKENTTKGVLHCFSQSVEMAKECVKLGYYLGIGGVLTFKNSKEIKEVVSEIDIEHLLSETDGPYLAPSPFRGQINRPSYIKYVIEEISKIKNINIEQVKSILVKNAEQLFKI